MKLFLVIENIEEVQSGIVSEFIGIFSTQEKAAKACYNERCCVVPMELDVSYENVSVTPDGSFYPAFPNLVWKYGRWTLK